MGTKAKKTTTEMVVHQGKGAVGKQEKTPEQRIEAIRGYLDRMDALNLQRASGMILTGMELLGLKDQLGNGLFRETFETSLERPQFAYRTARRAMQDAHRVRTYMLKKGCVSLAQIWDIPPSQLSLTQRKELSGVIDQVVGNKSMRSVRSEIESAKKPINPAEAEAQQVAKVWMKLCRELTHEAVQGKTWKHLTPEARLAARNCLQAALEAMPK